jgi:hypothetical protein
MKQRRLRIAAGIFLELLRSRKVDFVIVPDAGADWPADTRVVNLEVAGSAVALDSWHTIVVTLESEAWPAVARDDVPEYRVRYQKRVPRAPGLKPEPDAHAAEIFDEANL